MSSLDADQRSTYEEFTDAGYNLVIRLEKLAIVNGRWLRGNRSRKMLFRMEARPEIVKEIETNRTFCAFTM